jgi:hypothetical protein
MLLWMDVPAALVKRRDGGESCRGREVAYLLAGGGRNLWGAVWRAVLLVALLRVSGGK